MSDVRADAPDTTALLAVRGLRTDFVVEDEVYRAVDGVDLTIGPGESVGLVGESGSGKTVTAMSILQLIPDPPGRIVGGSIEIDGIDLVRAPERVLRQVRGGRIACVFQDPLTSLNPVLQIGDQLTEMMRAHQDLDRRAARRRARELLDAVHIPQAERRLAEYPHELSGGMRQRVMIAMALIADPRLIIADEPTTALDVTIQAQILAILKSVKTESSTGIILITHDLGIVADICDTVTVMYGGLIVERGPVEPIFANPRHPYTRGLLASVPNPEVDTKGRLVPIPGQPPDLFRPPAGCPFAARCRHTMKVCLTKMPPYFDVAGTHRVACWLEHDHIRGRSTVGTLVGEEGEDE